MNLARFLSTTLPAFGLFLSVSCAQHRAIYTDKLEPFECGSVERIHTYGGIFLASQPQPGDFEQAKEGGIKTVVNLRKEGELDWNEQEVVTNLRLEYYSVPWNGPGELTDQVFEEVRALLNDADKRPLLLHCGSANRVGPIWMAHRVLDDGLGIEEAAAEAKTVGMRLPAYEEKAREYIKRTQSQP